MRSRGRSARTPPSVRRMNLHPPFDEATTVDLRAERRLAATTSRCSTRRSSSARLRRGPQGAGGPPRPRRHEAARHRALSTYIEMCGLAPSNILGALRYAAGGWDGATIECRPVGKVIVKTGTSPHGQGHETSLVADRGRRARRRRPTTSRCCTATPRSRRSGMDTYGSRSLSVGGVALHFAMEKVKEKARTIAAHELEVGEDDLEWADGAFRVKGAPDKARTIPELAVSRVARARPAGRGRAPPRRPRPSTTRPTSRGRPAPTSAWSRSTPRPAGPTSCKYVAVDDCGTIINPMIVEGQVHGGVAQGVAEALYEEAIYDEGGQPHPRRR